MKLRLLIGALFLAGLVWAEEEPRVFPHDAIDSPDGFRKTLAEAFPSLETCCYLDNGGVLVAVYREKEVPRIMIVIQEDLGGTLEIKRNGKKMPLPPGDPAKIRVAWSLSRWDGTIVDHPEGRFNEITVGYWMPLKRTDTFEMTCLASYRTKTRYRTKTQFRVTYDPDRRWAGSVSYPEFDESRVKPGDAYEISLESLLGRVIEVLAKKDTCRVQMKDSRDVNLQAWKKEPEGEYLPMGLTVRDGISINFGPAEEKLVPEELAPRLEMYASACRAANMAACIRLRVGKDSSDELFRETLRRIAREHLGRVYVEMMESPREIPPERSGEQSE